MIFAGGSAVALVSCGSQGGDGGTPPVGGTQGAARVKSGEMFDDDSSEILQRYGAVNSRYSGAQKAGEEGNRKNEEFKGEFADRSFEGKAFDKKSFWGSKDYAKQVYGGDTDGGRFLTSAREGAIDAREGGSRSRDGGKRYETGAFGTEAAKETGRGKIDRLSDAETDVRRRVFQQPEVEDWRPKRALSVEDTKAMLGR